MSSLDERLDSRVFESLSSSSDNDEDTDEEFYEFLTMRSEKNVVEKVNIADHENIAQSEQIDSIAAQTNYRLHTLKQNRLSRKLLAAASRSSLRRLRSTQNTSTTRPSMLPQKAILAARRSSSRALRNKKDISGKTSPRARVVRMDFKDTTSESLSSQDTDDFSPAVMAKHLTQHDDIYSSLVNSNKRTDYPTTNVDAPSGPPPTPSRRRADTRELVMKKERMSRRLSKAQSSIAHLRSPVVPDDAQCDILNIDFEEAKVVVPVKEEPKKKKSSVFSDIISGEFFRNRSASTTSTSSNEAAKKMSCCVCNAPFDDSHSRACVDCGKWYCRKCKKLKMKRLEKKTWSCQSHKIREKGRARAVSIPDQKLLAEIHARVLELLRDGRSYFNIKTALLNEYSVNKDFIELHKRKIRTACFEYSLNRTIDMAVKDGHQSREEILKNLSMEYGEDAAKASMVYVDYLMMQKEIRDAVNKLVDEDDLTKSNIRARVIDRFANETKYSASLADEVEEIVDRVYVVLSLSLFLCFSLSYLLLLLCIYS
jgi:hypothetical protein